MEPKQGQFIELRAAGQSYNNISVQLKVSKPTLIKWSREFSHEIKNAKALQLETIREEYLLSHEHRLRILGTQLNKITKEILKRDLSEVPTWRLFDMHRKTINQIAKNDNETEFTVDIPFDSEESMTKMLNQTIKWKG